jgi:hypothetical protein
MWQLLAAAALQLAGMQQQKQAIKADAAFAAQQQLAAAGRSRASGQRRAADERRQARLVESALQARAAGGGLDPTAVNLAANIAGEGEYRALTALYEGDAGAMDLERQADATRRTAQARASAINLKMATTALGASSDFGGPSNTKTMTDKYLN